MLEEKTRKKLNDLIYCYDSLKNDNNMRSFFLNTIDIINHDQHFQGVINPIIDHKNISLATDTIIDNNLINIYLNGENEKEEVIELNKNTFKNLNLKYYYSYQLNNIFNLLGILHECIHVKQVLYKYGIYKNSKLSKLYNDVLNPNYKYFYKEYPLAYSFERNANLESCSELFEILKDSNYKELISFIYLLESDLLKTDMFYNHGYEIRNKKIISPTERTYNLMFNKEQIPYYNMPEKTLFEHGLPIRIEEYDEILKACNSELTYIGAYKNIQECFKKIDNKKLLKNKKYS